MQKSRNPVAAMRGVFATRRGAVVANRLVFVSAVIFLVPIDALGAPVFVSFDATRSSGTGSVAEPTVTGELLSFSSGSGYQSARMAITQDFPGSTFLTVPQLTPGSLSGTIFVSGLLAKDQDLSTAEQIALYDFVSDGGAALIFGELTEFLNASNSITQPFSVTFGGTLFTAPVLATMTDPFHPIADGPFGTVDTFYEAWVTAITDLGPYADAIAVNALGDTLAVIPRNAISPGSGPVVIYSDASPFEDTSSPPYGFQDNATLFRNTIAYLVPEPSSICLLTSILLTSVGACRRNTHP